MKEYNLKIELECHDNKGKDKKFTVNDLNTETIKLINITRPSTKIDINTNEKIMVFKKTGSNKSKKKSKKKSK